MSEYAEPPPRPALVRSADDCEVRPIAEVLRDVRRSPAWTCSGLVIANADAEGCRLDAIDLAFWEGEARSCRRYRTIEQALHADALAERDAQIRDARRAGRALATRAGVLGFAGGVVATSAAVLLVVTR